jgi:hypothetical protein
MTEQRSILLRPGSGSVPDGGFGILVPLAGPTAALGTGDFTVEMWVKSEKDSLIEWGGCRAGFQDGANWMRAHALVDRSSSRTPSFFGLAAYGDALSFGVGDKDRLEGSVCEPVFLNDEAWHHLAAVRQGDTIRVFVDGVSTRVLRDLPAGDVSFQGQGAPGGEEEYLVVGGWKNANTIPSWRGWIDELRLSGTARYPSAPRPTAPFEPDEQTAALYHFDQLQDGIAPEATGDPLLQALLADDSAASFSIHYTRETPFE